MARGLGLTALRVALGGLSGVGQDRAAMREAQRVEQEQARALERQRAMDELAMLNQGFMRAEDAAGERQQTGAALGRALSSATAMMRPGGLAAGAMPSLQTGDLRRTAAAPGLESPQQRVTLGGVGYQREAPFAKAAREAEQELARKRIADEATQAMQRREQDANVTAAMKAYNLTREQAQEYVRTGKSPIVEAQRPMTAAEKDAAARGWASIEVDKEKAAADRLKAGAQPPIDKRLPVGARNSIADYNAAIRTLQDAALQVEKNPGAFGLSQAAASKFGAVGRNVRELVEGQKSQDYTRARAQMQSALMKLRKTQFGTQMTRLEKETGEEVFPSGAESAERLMTMLEVLAGNAENLRRGVYEANNADDMYQPLIFEPIRRAALPTSPQQKKASLSSFDSR